MGYARKRGDGASLLLLALGGIAAVGASAMAGWAPSLHNAVRLDAGNAAFLALVIAAVGLVGNAIWTLLIEQFCFAWRWWALVAVLAAVFVGVAIRLAWPLPAGVMIVGGAVAFGFEVLELLHIPFKIGELIFSAAKSIGRGGSNLVGPSS